MKTIKIGFTDFWPNWPKEDNFIVRILKERYHVEVTDNPDYLFYSVFSNQYLHHDGIRIFYTGENLVPDFNLCDYGIGFSLLDFNDRYVRYPLYLNYNTDFAMAKTKHLSAESAIKHQTKFCNFVYSNKDAPPERKTFKDLLNSYQTVDSGGRYENNVGGPVEDKLAFQTQYRFSIAFENDSTPGYITEKLIQAFAAKTIPIYWGDPDVGKYFNTKAFVNVHDYPSFEAVLKDIQRLDQDEQARLTMLQEPMLLPEQEHYHDRVEASLKAFLFKIFDQPYDKAFRRSRQFQGKYYNDERKELFALRSNFAYRVIRKISRMFKK